MYFLVTYISLFCTENEIIARTTHVKRQKEADVIVKTFSKREQASPGLIHASQSNLHSVRTPLQGQKFCAHTIVPFPACVYYSDNGQNAIIEYMNARISSTVKHVCVHFFAHSLKGKKTAIKIEFPQALPWHGNIIVYTLQGTCNLIIAMCSYTSLL